MFRRKYGTIKRGKSMMALACDDDGGTGLRYFHYVEINEKDGSGLGAVLFTVHSARPSKASRSNSIADVHRERSAIVARTPAMKDALRVRPLAPNTFDVACRSCITQTLITPSFGVYDYLPKAICGPVVMESDGASAAILTLNASRTAESSDEAVFLSCGPSSDNLRLHTSIRVVRLCK